ncbi:MAG: hypothetical protein GC191_16120 [Azospirillum sp.]|nr:hypothetical protein [Azospirillum sp.]
MLIMGQTPDVQGDTLPPGSTRDQRILTVPLLVGAGDPGNDARTIVNLSQSHGRPVTFKLDNAVLFLTTSQFADLGDGQSADLGFRFDVFDGRRSEPETVTIRLIGRGDSVELQAVATVAGTPEVGTGHGCHAANATGSAWLIGISALA